MASTITVIGGGIFGLSCAWALARRGAAVRVIEAAHIGAGASGGTVGALAPHVPEPWNAKKALQRDALVAADRWWTEIAAAGGLDPGYARTGRLQPGATTPERIAAARAHWRGFDLGTTAAPDSALVPDAPGGLWTLDDITARVAPRRALAALAAAISAKGGQIEERAGPQDPGAHGAAHLGTVIWATGWQGLETLGADIGRPMGLGVKGQSALLDFAAPGAPQVFADGVHIVPHADGTVAIGSTSENGVLTPGTDDQLDDLIARARAICPALAGAPVVDRWSGIRPRARTRAPLVGPWPGRPGHYVANGGFKIGFAMAPAVAEMLADLLDGADRIPPAFLPENC